MTSSKRDGHGPRGIALLGCGDAARMHSKTLSSITSDRPLFHASRDASKARDFARELGGAGHFGDYESALRDERVEVALVLTPPAHHEQWTVAALQAGKHVIVEKPAFLSPGEFDRVEEAARDAGRRVMVAENYHYKPLAEALRRVLREKTLGDLLFIRADAVKLQETDGWREDPELTGGGALLEGGIHWVSLLAHLGPEVARVEAVRPHGSGETPERSIALLMEYADGGAASLSYSWDVPSALKGLRLSHIHGTEGSATFESNGLFLAVRGRSWSVRFPGVRDIQGYRAMFRDLLGAIEEDREPEFRLRDARRDVELVAEAYRSAGIPRLETFEASSHSQKSNRNRGQHT